MRPERMGLDAARGEVSYATPQRVARVADAHPCRAARPAEVVTVTPAWNIVEYRGRAGLLRLEADWRRLYAAMPQRTSYHVYEAHLAYVDHLMAAPDELRCLALGDGQKVRAICLLEPKVDRNLGRPVRVWRSPPARHTRSRTSSAPKTTRGGCSSRRLSIICGATAAVAGCWSWGRCPRTLASGTGCGDWAGASTAGAP